MKLILNSKSSTKNSVQFFSEKLAGKTVQFYSSPSEANRKEVQALHQTEEAKGKFGEMIFFRNSEQGHELFVGLGEINKLSSEKIRSLAAKIYKKLHGEKVATVQIAVDSFPMKNKGELVSALTEGLLLAAYEFTTFKEAPKKKYELEVTLLSSSTNKALKAALNDAEIVAEAVNFARWMGDCPGNFMTPNQLGEEAKNAAKGTKMKVSVWNKARIAKEKMDSLIGVSNGSAEEPRFIIMEYQGGSAKQPPICFVGKGLTFDCGGISMKPPGGMEEMKYDMCGGSAVIGAMSAIAKLKLKVNAIGIVPASENMPGPAANKPGDIRSARNGKSIEVNNTDAEGRLILADALVYACEQKPAWIVDVATLTGAMMIALGNIHTGFYSKDKKLVDKINKASEQSGEQMWRMPLTEQHGEDMKGTYADLTNLAPSRNAGSATAAAFLENFVDSKIPWAHVDIAGTAWHVGGRLSYAPSKGASGVMVRTFVDLARNQ